MQWSATPTHDNRCNSLTSSGFAEGGGGGGGPRFSEDVAGCGGGGGGRPTKTGSCCRMFLEGARQRGTATVGSR